MRLAQFQPILQHQPNCLEEPSSIRPGSGHPLHGEFCLGERQSIT